MRISDIYSKYHQMDNLQLHQLRVAAVAKIIIDNLDIEVDEQNVITACLLHDTGNIIKFDLSHFPQFLEPEGLDYWQKIKDSYIEKYGANEHHASMEIARELGVSERVLKLIDQISFSKEIENEATDDFGIKICAYADMRVGPHGVLSLAERLADGRARYKNRKSFDILKSEELNAALSKIELQLFTHSRITHSKITDAIVDPLVDRLKNYEI